MYLINKSITLLELIISIIFFSIIVLGAISFETFNRRMLNTIDRRTKVVNDLSYILDFVSKDAVLGSGGINNPVFSNLNNGFSIRQDTNMDGNVDRTIGYIRTQNKLERCELNNSNACIAGTSLILTSNLKDFQVNPIGSCRLSLNIEIDSGKTPDIPQVNPHVRLSTTVISSNCSES